MFRHTLAVSAAVILVVALVTAQQNTQPRPTFRTEANFIRVDAYVTRDGTPVEDLVAADFEVLEDGVPQAIDTFEHVRIRPAGPQAARVEPNNQQAANQMAADPRSRIFVLFLDVAHVPLEGSHRLKTAMTQMLSQMVAEDDFIGVITSRHSPSDLILGRKTALIEEQLEKYWYWGQRDSQLTIDPEEEAYRSCFIWYRGGEEVAFEMIDRRREKMTMDALSDLTVHLRGLREERKAVLAVTTGWQLFRPNPALARPLVATGDPNQTARVPQPPSIGIAPGGRPVLTNDPRLGATMARCEEHRQVLAYLDNWQAFRDLVQDANRANVSFYPIDPRGLVVFDSPMGPRNPPTLSVDRAILRVRQDSLRTMAGETDGLAVVDSNNLTAGLRRVTADLTSYYLLGYYARNAALDGKYRRITVRVKRPGVEVRARKGYRAATAEEVARGTASASSPATPQSAAAATIAKSLSRLALIRPDAALYVQATHQPGGPLWVAGELPGGLARSAAWAQGARVTIIAVDEAGSTLGMARKEITPGERDFLLPISLNDASKTPAKVQVRAEPQGAAAVGVEVTPLAGEPLLLRRSAAGRQPRAAADYRFYRTEELLYRWTLEGGESVGSARVLDRNGAAMPLTATASDEAVDGIRWMAGKLTLAPLANGDYLLELTKRSGDRQVTSMVPFRIVR